MSYKIKSKAFTLIELLVVIAIIAILAAILFPVFAQAKTAAKQTTSVSNVKNMATAFLIYASDNDDAFSFSQDGSGGPGNPQTLRAWATYNGPYIKSGTTHPEKQGIAQNNGGDGIFRDPAAPAVSNSRIASVVAALPGTPMPTYQWGYSYGVNPNIFAVNSWSEDPSFSNDQLSRSMTTTMFDEPGDKVTLMSKGVQSTDATNDQGGYTYPYFIAKQEQYIGTIVTGGAVTRDGDESATTKPGVTLPDGFTGNALYDTDCGSTSCHGAWEAAGHPRYRYNGNALAAFADGHAKSIKKGSLKWYKNLYVNNPGIAKYAWDYYSWGVGLDQPF